MSIRWFVKESRTYMAHLSDGEFYCRLPLALFIYMKLEVIEWIRSKTSRLRSLVR